jgi:hypothetical protein
VEKLKEKRSTYKILVGRSEGNKPFGKPKLIWDDTTKMVLKEITGDVVYWIHLAQNVGH